jgi:DNA-directed RNA polymerase specialized sigma24 family protein
VGTIKSRLARARMQMKQKIVGSERESHPMPASILVYK